MMKKLLFLSMVLFVSASLFAQDAKEMLSAIQSKYKSAKDISVDFTQSTGNKQGLSGKMLYSQGNKFRVEVKNMTIVSDGSTMWNYNDSRKQVVINNSDKDNQFFTIDNFLYDYPAKCSISKEEDNGKTVLVLTPNKNSGISFSKARIWIGQDNLINRIVVENQNNSDMNVVFSGYSLNKNIPDSKFSFSPPEGTKIIDLRK